jgi:hypothetical protein
MSVVLTGLKATLPTKCKAGQWWRGGLVIHPAANAMGIGQAALSDGFAEGRGR